MKICLRRTGRLMFQPQNTCLHCRCRHMSLSWQNAADDDLRRRPAESRRSGRKLEPHRTVDQVDQGLRTFPFLNRKPARQLLSQRRDVLIIKYVAALRGFVDNNSVTLEPWNDFDLRTFQFCDTSQTNLINRRLTASLKLFSFRQLHYP